MTNGSFVRAAPGKKCHSIVIRDAYTCVPYGHTKSLEANVRK